MNKAILVAALVFEILLSGCASVKIARINADPSRYYNRTVHVDGTVVTSIGVLGTGGYQLDDGTGKIFVISRTGVPSGGTRVAVTGRVMGGAQILGQTVATAIREDHHTVR